MAEDILKENSEDGTNVPSQANIDVDNIDDLHCEPIDIEEID